MSKQGDVEIIKDLVDRQVWHFVEIKSFFLSLRGIMEHDGLKKKMKILNFYGNWCAHIELKQSDEAFQMLEELTPLLIETLGPNKKAEEYYYQKITNLLSLERLKGEIIEILNLHGIKLPEFLNDKESYFKFCETLLNFLMEKPLKFDGPPFKNKNQEKIYNNIINTAEQLNAKGYACIEMRFATSVLDDNRISIEVKLMNGFTYLIPEVRSFHK